MVPLPCADPDRPVDHRVDVHDRGADQQRRDERQHLPEPRIAQAYRRPQPQPDRAYRRELEHEPNQRSDHEADGQGRRAVHRTEEPGRRDHHQVERDSLQARPEELPVRLRRGGEQVRTRDEHRRHEQDPGQADGLECSGVVEARGEERQQRFGRQEHHHRAREQHRHGDGEGDAHGAVAALGFAGVDRPGHRRDQCPRHRPGDQAEDEVHQALRDEERVDGGGRTEDRGHHGVADEAEQLARRGQDGDQRRRADDRPPGHAHLPTRVRAGRPALSPPVPA